MNKPLLALAVAGALATTLAGCSDSGDDDPAPTTPATPSTPTTPETGDNGGGQTELPTRPSGPRAPGGGGAPAGDTTAGNYIGGGGSGTFGFGNGVYVVDANNELAGLALNDDGSARSFFGSLGDGDSFTGTFRTYEHSASNPPSAGGFGTGPTGDVDRVFTDSYTLNIVPGQTIADDETSLLFADGDGRIAPATVDSVAGDWRGVNQFAPCDAAAPAAACQLVFDITFTGTAVSGTTSVTLGSGEPSRVSAVTGQIEEFGDTLLLTFSWNDSGGDGVSNDYQGVAFFPDSTGRLVFLGETLDAGAGNPTLASLLSR